MQSDFNELSSLSLKFPHLEFLCRGTGNAKYLYVCSKISAVEISIDLSGYFFEAWSVADEDSDEAPLISEQVDSVQDLERMLQAWFSSGDNS